MKVAFITTHYLPFTGGVENHTASLAQSLSAGHEVKAAALRFRPQTLPARLGVLGNNLLAPRREETRQDGKVRVISLGPNLWERLQLLPLALRAIPRIQRWFYEQLNRMTRPAFLRAFASRLKEAIAGADIVHCMAFGDLGIAAQAVAHRCGIPFVCTPFVHPNQWGDGKDDVEYYKRCEAVIALTQSDRDYLVSLGVAPARLHIIGVAPQISEKRDADGFRRQHGLEGLPIVLYLGRMMYKKGSRELLASARRVWEELPQARFVFIGPNDSPDPNLFQGVDTRILYLGVVSKEQKCDALEACDVLCLPSMSEILPTVYLEAWSCKKPVIAGYAPGLRELVEGNEGGVCVPQEEGEITAAIVRLLNDPDLRARLGRNGADLVEKSFSVQRIATQHEQVYETVCRDFQPQAS